MINIWINILNQVDRAEIKKDKTKKVYIILDIICIIDMYNS